MELLLFAEADPSAVNLSGRTPLHFGRTEEVVDILLECGSHPGFVDEEGRTPLFALALAGRTSAVRALLAAESGQAVLDLPDKRGDTPTHAATSANHVELLILLLSAGADLIAVNEDGFSAMQVAERNEHAECAAAIKEKGAQHLPSGWAVFCESISRFIRNPSRNSHHSITSRSS